MKQIRVVLIGFGGMGRQYARMIYDGQVPGMVLTGVCCRNAAGQELLKNEYPKVAIYPTVDAVVEQRDNFDAAIIVTPHITHVPIAQKIARIGKHILLDKPAGVDATSVRELVEICEQERISFAMMFNNRRLPAFRKGKELLESGALGELHRAVWVCNNWYRSPAYHRSAPWRSSWNGECGGLLLNQNQHYLDMWQWFFGMPDHVYASLEFGRYNHFLVDDAADIQFFHHGFHGTMISATGESPGINRLEIWGTAGCLRIEETARVFLNENLIPMAEFAEKNQEIYAEIPHAQRELTLDKPGHPYQEVLTNFAEHLLYGVPLYADGREGLKTVQLTNAAYVSGWQERKVSLPVDEGLYRNELASRQLEEQKWLQMK